MELGQAIAAALEGRTDIRLAMLFGSHAAGRVTALSDVDVGILYEGDPDLLEVGSLASRLERALKKRIDLVTLNDLPRSSPAFAYHIARTGIPVLLRDAEELVSFKRSACLHYLDTRDLRAMVRRRLTGRMEQGETGLRDYV